MGAVLFLLPLTGVWAQAVAGLAPWAWCEPDELAPDIVPATPDAPPIDRQPLRAEADQVESSSTRSLLEGNVSLSRGDQRLRADRITLDRPANRARAEGEFVYGDPRQALRGQQADVDLNAETGWFRGVDYYLPGRNAQGSAEAVRVDQRRQRSWLEGATYSTCPRGREAWQLRAREMKLNHATGRGSANHLVLAFRDWPVFYFPYLSFPITDERQSGFLFPRQGYGSETGWNLTIPYYWNIAPNRDLTLTPRLMTARGILLGAEYRYLEPWHRGELDLGYIPDDRRYGGARSSFNLRDQAVPLPNLYTDLRYEYVSDDHYLRDLSNNLSFLTDNYLVRYLDARYFGADWQALARIQGYQILTPALFAATGKPYERLPQLVFDGERSLGAGGLSYQLHGQLTRFHQTDVVTGTRLDLWPTVNWSLGQPWGYLKPRAGFRYTSYWLEDTAPGASTNPSRAAPVLDVDGGLIFERPLRAGWLGLASGTQTLEPRLFYLNVPYRDQNDIPLFDSARMDPNFDWLFRRNRFVGADRLGDANQLTAALTTRVLDGPSGRERLRASVGQIQYFEDRRVTLEPDKPPETADNSGLIAQGQVNLSSRWSLQAGAQLEPDNRDLLRTGFDLRYYANPRQLVNVSYLLDRDQPALDDRIDPIHSVDVSLLWPLSAQWRITARWNRALNLDRNLEVLAGLEYEDCCWAVRAVTRQYRSSPMNVESQNALYLEIELKGLSRLGIGLDALLQNSILSN